MLVWIFYLVGLVLSLALQIENSLLSKSNSLEGLSGVKTWLTHNAVATLLRAFLCVVAMPKIVSIISESGVGLTAWGSAGVAGVASMSLLNQVFGLIPALRAEMPLLAPPDPSSSTAVQGE